MKTQITTEKKRKSSLLTVFFLLLFSVCFLPVSAQEVTIQDSELTYEDFLGTYTMWFNRNSEYPPTTGRRGAYRTQSATVSLVEAVPGESYFLKGILSPADEERGNIIITYNDKYGRLELRGQKLFTRTESDQVFWLIPHGFIVSSGNGTRWTPSNARRRGMGSANYKSSEKELVFEMVHLAETTSGSTCTGFRLVNLKNDSDGGVGIPVTGAIKSSQFNFMIFEKQN